MIVILMRLLPLLLSWEDIYVWQWHGRHQNYVHKTSEVWIWISFHSEILCNINEINLSPQEMDYGSKISNSNFDFFGLNRWMAIRLYFSRDNSRANAVQCLYWLGGWWKGGTIIDASSQYIHGRALTVRDYEKLKERAERSFMKESKDINYYLINDYI